MITLVTSPKDTHSKLGIINDIFGKFLQHHMSWKLASYVGDEKSIAIEDT